MGTEMKKFFLSGTSKLIFNKKGTKKGIAVAIVTELRESFIDLHMYSAAVIV